MNKAVYHNLKQIAFLYNVKFLLWWAKFNPIEQKYLLEDAKGKREILLDNPDLFSLKTHLLKRKVKKSEFLRKQKIRFWIGGRGSAKTNTIGKLIRQMFSELPQAICGLASLSFTHIERNILPEVFFALNQEGLEENKHFVYGKQPPKHWKKCFRQVKDYTRVISFINGFTIILLSQENKNVNRGMSLDALIGDEVAFLQPDWWRKVLMPTVRANPKKKIAKSPLHLGKFAFSSAPDTLEGQYVFNYDTLAKENPDEYFFIESTPLDNKNALPANYIQELKDSMTEIEFAIEVMNQRLDKLPDSFYPSFDEKIHVWESNQDYYPDKPLELSIDRNAGFTSCTVSQSPDIKRLNFINQLWVKWETIDKLMDKVSDIYAKHPKRVIHLYGDRNLYDIDKDSGIAYIDLIIKQLSNRGWAVVNFVSPANLEHSIRHYVINLGLKEATNYSPIIRINKQECKALKLSILNTPIKDDYKKNKDSEKMNIAQEQATHLSDCFDYRAYPFFAPHILQGSSTLNSETAFIK